MAVEIDNVVYTLGLQSPSTILYGGRAPIALHSYRYVKINKANFRTTPEGFYRSPELEDTVNEFFNRTWNKKHIASFPQVYEPLPVIKRIPTQLHRNGEIPTIHLITKQEDVDNMHDGYNKDINVNANMSYVSLNDSLFYDQVKLSIAGHTSRWYNKVSYSIKLRKSDTIYGFRRIKLRAMANDPSYLREQIAYDMLKSLGLPTSEFSYCRVFLNNVELGLFGLIEPFHDPWTANEFSDGDKGYVSGNLYQGNGHSPTKLYSDLGYMDNLTAYADGQYLMKAGNKSDFGPLQMFTKFIKKAPVCDEDAVDIWNSKLDMDTFLRSMVLEVLNAYFDGYIARAHNYYLYKNPDTGAFIYISADLDATIGHSISSLKPMMSGNYSTFPGIHERPLIAKVLQVKEFRNQFSEMILHVTEKLVNPEATNERIDGLVDMITEDVNWDHTTPRMGSLVRKIFNLFSIKSENGRAPSGLDLIPLIQKTIASKSAEIQEFTSRIPKNPGDQLRVIDSIIIILQGMPFLKAVNGPTGHDSCIGIKEFIRIMSHNVRQFYRYTNR
ncbi:unnamed protein product [Rhizopus stolonifer]